MPVALITGRDRGASGSRWRVTSPPPSGHSSSMPAASNAGATTAELARVTKVVAFGGYVRG